MLPIVVVDDLESDLFMAERILRQCKILNPIELIRSGNGCISYFEAKNGYEERVLPCLLLMDLIMPTPGVEVLRYLKDRGFIKDSIVVMLSGLQDFKAIHEGYQLGARTFLVKPLTIEDVVQMISALPGLQVKQEADGNIVSLVPKEQIDTIRDRMAGMVKQVAPI
jgi:CheY-like chemotaxis protein